MKINKKLCYKTEGNNLKGKKEDKYCDLATKLPVGPVKQASCLHKNEARAVLDTRNTYLKFRSGAFGA